MSLPFIDGQVLHAGDLNLLAISSSLASTTDMTKGVALVGGAARLVASIAALRALPTTGSPEVFVTGYYVQGDGGGGAFWYNSADTTSSDNGGTIIVSTDGGRWYLARTDSISILQWGAKPDAGVTDNSTVLANAAAWLAVGTVQNTLRFPAGIYGYSVSPNWAANHGRIIAEGEVRLRYSGTGNAVIIDAGAGTQVIYDVTFGTPNNPFIIEAPSTALNACFVRSIHHSHIAVKPRGAGSSSAGLLINFAVCTEFAVTCSVNEDGGWYTGAKPAYGVYLDNRGASEQTSYCKFQTPIIEGPTYGLYFANSIGNIVFGGTSEGCVSGAYFISGATGNRIIGTDFEANTSSDIQITGPSNFNEFIGCDTALVLLIASGNGNRVIGGRHNTITISAGSGNSFVDTTYCAQGSSGAFTDTTGTSIKTRVYNAYTGLFDQDVGSYSTLPTAAPAVGASPFRYTNNLNYPVDVIYTGGTISQVTLKRGGLEVSVALNSLVRLDPGDSSQVTFSATPNLSLFPRPA